MKGKEWKGAALLTATLYPSIVFGIGFFINLFIWGKHSSGAIPFLTILGVVAMWFGISLPLVVLGYFFGYRKQPYEHPVRTNQIPRQVPTQVSHCHTSQNSCPETKLDFELVDDFFLLDLDHDHICGVEAWHI